MTTNTRRASTVATVAVGVLVTVAGWAVAGPTETAAREETTQATAAYNLGRFDDAAALYEHAYTLSPNATLLFNIGQSYRQAGKPEKALNAYKSYLRTAPADAPNRAQVQARIDELERIVSATRTSQAAPPAGAIAPPGPPVAAASPAPALAVQAAPSPAGEPDRPLYARWWLWAGVVAGGIIAAVALSGDKTGRPACPGDVKSCM